MFYFSDRNPRVPCSHLPGLNLNLWKENVAAAVSAPNVPSRPLALVSPPSPSTTKCTIGGKQMGVGGAGLQSPCVSCVCRPDGVSLPTESLFPLNTHST